MGRPEDVAEERPIGRGDDGTQWGEPCSDSGRGRPRGEHGDACPSNTGRSSDKTAGPPRGAGAGPAPPADAEGVAAPPPPLVGAAAPTGRGSVRQSRPLGSHGIRRPGGNGGRAEMGGRALVGPGVADVDGAGTASGAATTADGLAQGRGGRSPDRVGGRSRQGQGGRSPDGAVGGRRRGRLHLSRRGCSTTGTPSSSEALPVGRRGRGGRRGLATSATMGADGTLACERGGRPARARLHATEGSRPAAAPIGLAPRVGGRVAAARGLCRRQPTGRHAAVAASCAPYGHSPSSAMIASGALTGMEGTICIGW